MIRDPLKRALLGAAVALGLAGAALGRAPSPRPPAALAARAPGVVSPRDLARTLSEAPPDVVVVALDDARHPLRGAVPAAFYGRTDDELVARAPAGMRLVLAGRDPVRADRLARRLLAAGRSARVLDGAIPAWDRAMDADPPPPPPTADADAWARHRRDAALRRAFGDAAAAPAPVPVRPTVPRPTAAPAGAAARREGC